MGWNHIQCQSLPPYSPGQSHCQCIHQPVSEPKYVLSFLNANPGFIFHIDKARPHTARAKINHLNNHNVNILPWPSKSADLNLIEHIWNEFDNRLKKRAVQPQTRADLRQALQQE